MSYIYIYQHGFSVQIYKKDTESLIERVKKSIYPYGPGELKNIYITGIDNKKAYQVVASCGFSIISTFVESENYVYEFFIKNPETPEDIIKYNQILSTFKFTEK